MVWEGVSGVKHIFLHIRRATCAAYVSRTCTHILAHVCRMMCRDVYVISTYVCRDCMLYDDVRLDEMYVSRRDVCVRSSRDL